MLHVEHSAAPSALCVLHMFCMRLQLVAQPGVALQFPQTSDGVCTIQGHRRQQGARAPQALQHPHRRTVNQAPRQLWDNLGRSFSCMMIRP